MANYMPTATLLIAITLASSTSASESTNTPTTPPLLPRQISKAIPFSGTADAIDRYDPHDYVPPHYSIVRVAHAVTMSIVWLLIFPLGGIIPRVMSDPRLVWVHAIIQMVGFWLNVAAAAMGIWMAQQIRMLHYYHPVLGLVLLGLLALQPATEILNHSFYQRHPKMIVTAHIHLWLGRGLLIAGAVQGGLGFLFAAGFRNAHVETWPRVLYAATALVVWVVYILVGILYPEFRGSIKSKIREAKMGHGQRRVAVRAGEMEDLRVEGRRGSVGVGAGQGHAAGYMGGRMGHVEHARGLSSAPLTSPQANMGGFSGYQRSGYEGGLYQGG